MTESNTPAKVATSAELGPLRELAQEGAAMHSPGMPERTLCDGLLAALDEVELLRGIVAKGRAAYSAYGLLATPPNHDMHTEAGDKLRSEWLRETDDYLHGLEA